MTRGSLVLALVAIFCLGGVASAQTTPPATPSVAPATVAVPVTTVAPAIEAPAIDLAQIFAAPTTGAMTKLPAPTWRSCTLLECKAPCRQPGCFASCIDLETCECEAICN